MKQNNDFQHRGRLYSAAVLLCAAMIFMVFGAGTNRTGTKPTCVESQVIAVVKPIDGSMPVRETVIPTMPPAPTAINASQATSVSTAMPAIAVPQSPPPDNSEQTKNVTLDTSIIATKNTSRHYYSVNVLTHPFSLWQSERNIIENYGGFVQGDTEEKKIYLTFNLGTERGHTERTLEILADYGIKASFFCLGEYVEYDTDTFMKVYNAGHLILNHGNQHIYTADKSVTAAADNITKFYDTVKKITGITLEEHYYRPPSGEYSERNLEIARQLGETPVFWTFTYNDYLREQLVSDKEILKLLIGNLKNGAIYQLHTTNAGNNNVLCEFIETARSMGYSFATVDELAD